MFSRIAGIIGRPSVGLSEDINFSFFAGAIDVAKTMGAIVCTLAAMTALVFLIINITKLATSAGNENGRASALRGILISGIALALAGGGTVVIAMSLGLLRN